MTDDSTSTAVYVVRGMTCSHCVQSVSTAVGALPEVESVNVDLDAGAVTVVSRRSLDDDAVAAAIQGAGYELAARGGATQ